jgi:hypothetical protein
MSAPTLVGPTSTQQINTALYVGEGYLDSIQDAVDFAAASGDGFFVIIPSGYTGSDTIASIVGGTTLITIADRRIAQAQNYSWNGSAYVPAGLHEMGDITCDGVVTAASVRATTDIEYGLPDSSEMGYNHDAGHAVFLGTGPDVATIAGILLTGWNSDHSQNINYLGCNPNFCIFNTDLTVDKDLTVNGATNVTNLAASSANLGSLVVPGTATIYGDTTLYAPLTATTITANDASLATCEVANSPVRTFANTPDGGGGGMEWPPAGIAVSTGTAWGTSLDPANSFLPLTLTAPTTVNTGTNNLIIGGSTGTIYLGASTPANAVRITPGTYRATLQWPTALVISGNLDNLDSTYGAGDFVAPTGVLNRPPQLGSQYTALFAHTTDGSTGRSLQTAWNYGDSVAVSRLFIRNGTGAGWTPWTELLHDDGAGNLAISGTLTAGSVSAPNLATWPAAGVPVSTGTAWGTSIAAAVLARTNASNTFGAAQIFSPNNSTGITAPGSGLTIAWNLSAGAGETDFVNSVASGTRAFAWYNVASGASITSATQPLMTLASDGTLAVRAALEGTQLALSNPDTASAVNIVALQPNLTVGSTTSMYVGVANSANNVAVYGLQYQGPGSASNRGTIGMLGGSANATFDSSANWLFGGSVTCRNVNIQSSDFAHTAVLLSGAGTDTHFRINPGAGQIVALSWDSGTGVIIGNGAGAGVTSFDTSGNANFGGQITAYEIVATVKNFRISHPLHKDKQLTHSSLEGPEIAVFYRGEGQTDGTATATITLPDYFEALTKPENRTVLLTEIFEDDDTELGKLAASRVTDGQFRVRSEFALQKFYWEVKAVRADVDPLAIETEREAEHEGGTIGA